MVYDLYIDEYSFVGKIGIVQVNYKKGLRGISIGGYQVFFVGYFLVEVLKYFCIVVINKLCCGGFYGGDVVGLVFWEIVDNIYWVKLVLYLVFNVQVLLVYLENMLLGMSIGVQDDYWLLLVYLDMEVYGEFEI